MQMFVYCTLFIRDSVFICPDEKSSLCFANIYVNRLPEQLNLAECVRNMRACLNFDTIMNILVLSFFLSVMSRPWHFLEIPQTKLCQRLGANSSTYLARMFQNAQASVIKTVCDGNLYFILFAEQTRSAFIVNLLQAWSWYFRFLCWYISYS